MTIYEQSKEWLSQNYGLVCTHKNLANPEENSMLWTMELILKAMDEGDDITAYMLQLNLDKYIEDCATDVPGLYNQFPYGVLFDKDNYTSPDQLIAIVAHFYK